MALRFERRHLTFRTWFHKRPAGGGGEAAEVCCFLLLSGPTDEFLLLQDGCLELLGCAQEVECCILLENDTDGSQVVLLEDGAGCIEPEDCP